MSLESTLRLTTIALTSLLLAACPGNSPVKSPSLKADSGVGAPAYFDGGSYLPPAYDGGAAPAADLGTGVAGTKTCAELDACALACADTDTACFNACLAQGTAEAQAQLNSLEQCSNTAFAGSCASQCADPNAQACGTCIDAACAAQIQACFGTTGTTPPPTTTGTKTCAQIFDCYDTCNDQTCADNCFYAGTADAQAKADAVEQCWYTAEAGVCKTQCANPQSQVCYTCEDQACASQYAACGISF